MNDVIQELGQISDWFWSIIEHAEKNREKLRKILFEMSKDEIYSFQKEFVEASVELQTPPFTDFIEESEDSVEDVSHWIVSQGKEFYFKVWLTPEITPNYIDEGDLEILYGIAAEVYREKFNELIDIYG